MTKEKDRLREPSFFSAFPGALIDFSPRSARILQRATCFRGWIESKGTERGRKRQPSFRLFFLFFFFSLSLPRSLLSPSESASQHQILFFLALQLSLLHFTSLLQLFRLPLLAALLPAAPSSLLVVARPLLPPPRDNAGLSLGRPAGATRGLCALALCAG